jgi:hypothetical protein
LRVIKKDGIKYRVMDHGEAAPTCVLWFAYLPPSIMYRSFGVKSKGVHICYREYYQPGKIIKYHRERIAHLSAGEKYYGNYADPQIFKKTTQKYGGFWTNADDYTDFHGFTESERQRIPAIVWTPADNNESSCRDAVSELLELDENTFNPITGEPNSPALYFLIRHPVEYSQGASAVVQQLQAAKYKKVDTINGEAIYSDERDPGVPDHAYDPLRYYAIMRKMNDLPEIPRDSPERSFNRILQKRRFNRFRMTGRTYR